MLVKIKPETYQKVMHWVNKTDIEVSGFGLVEYDKATATFHVVDAFLLEQTGGAAHTDIDAVSLSKLMYKAHVHSQTTGREVALKWWWHSHVKMNVFWSGTDTATIKELGGQGWIAATVFNQKNEFKSAVCWKTESELGSSLSIIEDVKTEVTAPANPELIAAWDAEFKTNVKEKPAIAYSSGRHWGHDYTGDAAWDRQNNGWYPDVKKPDANGNTKGEVTKELTKSEFKKLKREYGMWGYLGYGLETEARVLGITPKTYLEKLMTGSSQDILDMENRLVHAEHTGVLFTPKHSGSV